MLPGPVSAGSLEAGSLEVAVLLVSKAGKEQGGSYQPLSSAPFDLLMTFAIGCTQPEVMRNAGLDEAQLESRLPGEISITSDMQITPPLWQKVKRN